MSTSVTHLPASIDILLCVLAMLIVLLPRFDQWPLSDAHRYEGKPKDYIHWERYLLFIMIYLGSFTLFAVALNMIPVAGELVSTEQSGFTQAAKSIMGEGSFLMAVMIALASLSSQHISTLDERWRSCLLTLARVPKDTLRLKQQLLLGLNELELNPHRLQPIIDNISQLGNGEFWAELSQKGEYEQATERLGKSLLRTLYIAASSRVFDLSELDLKNINNYEARLQEIAAVLPTMKQDSTQFRDYKKDIDSITSALLEMLAKNSIKSLPDADRLHAVLLQLGFKVAYYDERDMNLFMPLLYCLLAIPLACFISLIGGLGAFDLFGITRNSRSGATHWLEWDTLIQWGTGSTLSYAIAIAIGVIVGTLIRSRGGTPKFPSYFIAFAISTLGACAFFLVARDLLKPQLVWLAIAFGTMSCVALAAVNQDPIDSAFVRARSLQFGLRYGTLSGVLQAMITLSFAMSATDKAFEFDATRTAAFFYFGFIRGFLVATLIAFILLDYERGKIADARRRHPRISFRKIVNGIIAGNSAEVFVKDISEHGAMMQVRKGTRVQQGDAVTLAFGAADINGSIVWARQGKARVKFDNSNCPSPAWLAFVQHKLELAPL